MSSEYLKLLETNKEGKIAPSTETKNATEKKDDKEKDSTIKQLQEELKKKDADLQAMKQQAENQQSMFDKLNGEIKSLKNQLSDYDILMGDKNKKDK